MKTAHTVVAALLVVSTWLPASAQPQTENQAVRAVGTSRIYSENISSAKDQAVSDALITAVSLTAADLIPRPIMVQSFQDINRLLFLNADEFIQDYKVLTEASAGKIYRVLLEANVSTKKISDLLYQNNIATKSDRAIRVLLLVAEQNIDAELPACWWSDAAAKILSEGYLSDAMNREGLTLVSHEKSQSDLSSGSVSSPNGTAAANPADQRITGAPESLPAPTASASDTASASNVPASPESIPGPDMSDADAMSLGNHYQADIVVVGTAIAERAPNLLGNNMKSFKGTLTLRALRADTGQVVAQTTQSALSADSDDLQGGRNALASASTQAGQALADQIFSAWQAATENSKSAATTIVVEGAYELMHLVAFRKVLSEMPQVSNLRTKEMGVNETTLAVDLQGTPQELAKALLLKSFEGFGIHISEAGKDTLRLSLVSN